MIMEQVAKDGFKCAPELEIRWGYATKSPKPPALLHVCSDSREVAMHHYQLAFGGSHTSKHRSFIKEFKKSGLLEKQFWIDFQRDTILIRVQDFPSIDIVGSYLKIQNLAVVAGKLGAHPHIPWTDSPNHTLWERRLLVVLSELPMLRNLVVYYKDDLVDNRWISYAIAVKKALLKLFANPQEGFPDFATTIAPLKVNLKMERLVVSKYEEFS